MIIGFLKSEKDKKCPISPDLVKKYKNLGFSILAESNINDAAYFTKEQYSEDINFTTRSEILSSAEIIFSSDPLKKEEYSQIKEEAHFISLLEPYNKPEVVGQMAE